MTARLTAEAFVQARLARQSLEAFPGPLPTTLDEAYAIQDISLEAFPDHPGWKVAGVRPELRTALGAERTTGPVMRLLQAGSRPVEVEVISNGFAAVEAEFAFRIRSDLPSERNPTEAELRDAIGSLHIACEVAGSPLATISDLGPTATVSDLGNNLALIVGAEIPEWRSLPPEELKAAVIVDGQLVGEGSAAALPGGPLAAFAFLVSNLAARGRHIKAGDWVSTGATTGVHQTGPGAHVLLDFGAFGKIDLTLT